MRISEAMEGTPCAFVRPALAPFLRKALHTTSMVRISLGDVRCHDLDMEEPLEFKGRSTAGRRGFTLHGAH